MKQTYNRLDLATEQLDAAISLSLERKSFVSALTLAGAADEILGKALSHSGHKLSQAEVRDNGTHPYDATSNERRLHKG